MIFDKRIEMKPIEYNFQHYVDAIRNSFWTHTHYSYTSDIQDYKVNMTDIEREVAKRCMLSISQVEVAVKSFWADIHKVLPKPEIASVWITFWFNEVVHADFYSHLLEQLWLNDEFSKIKDIPVLQERVSYLQECLASKDEWREWFIKALIYFSLFIENVSLFSQFLIMMSYKTKNNMLKWMYNWILASTKEEDLHATFWADLINIIRKENPELFTKKLEAEVKNMSRTAMLAEMEIVERIFENWELSWIQKNEVKAYIVYRINKWLNSIWYKNENIPSHNPEIIEKLSWFEDTLKTTTHADFFDIKSPNYSKNLQTFDADDLF